MRFLRDTWILFSHNVRMTLRNPVWVFLGIFQPVLYLLLFAPLLDPLGNAPGFPDGGGLAVFTPAAMVMIGMFGATFVGFGLIAQLRAGEIERLRVTPASRLALLMGSVLRDVAQLVVQAALLVVIAVLLGPLYHLTSRSERVRAMQEAHRVLPRGGSRTRASFPWTLKSEWRMWKLEFSACAMPFHDSRFQAPNSVLRHEGEDE